MTLFVNRNSAYIRRICLPDEKHTLLGDTGAYLNVKLLSSGCIHKVLESMQSIRPHPQPQKFSAQQVLKTLIFFSIFSFLSVTYLFYYLVCYNRLLQ